MCSDNLIGFPFAGWKWWILNYVPLFLKLSHVPATDLVSIKKEKKFWVNVHTESLANASVIYSTDTFALVALGDITVLADVQGESFVLYRFLCLHSTSPRILHILAILSFHRRVAKRLMWRGSPAIWACSIFNDARFCGGTGARHPNGVSVSVVNPQGCESPA